MTRKIDAVGAAFEKYLERQPSGAADFQKAFTFGCGYTACQADMQPQLDELVGLLERALTASVLSASPLEEEIRTAIAKHRAPPEPA